MQETVTLTTIGKSMALVLSVANARVQMVKYIRLVTTMIFAGRWHARVACQVYAKRNQVNGGRASKLLALHKTLIIIEWFIMLVVGVVHALVQMVKHIKLATTLITAGRWHARVALQVHVEGKMFLKGQVSK